MASWLREQGFQAYALRGGYMAWRDAGYPMQSKATERQTVPGAATAAADICPACGRPMSEHRQQDELAA